MTAVDARPGDDRVEAHRDGPAEPPSLEAVCWCEVEAHGEVACLRVHGQVDRTNDAQLRRGAEEAAAAGRGVLVDLTDATFLDSGGLHVLIDLAEIQRATGHLLAIHDPSPFGRRVLAVAGLDALPDPPPSASGRGPGA